MLDSNESAGRARAVSRILVLGGYGGFGARVSAALAADGHDVVVAGRSLDKARAFCAGKPKLYPAAVDREAVAAALGFHRPAVLVDATGPFQGMAYDVPAACIAACIHYVDIADARAFVCGIGAFDAAAAAAGVVLLSGGSSVPALSGAAVRALADGMERVATIDLAISASGRAAAGPAVTAAILAQVGQPMRLWRGGRWTTAYGWRDGRTVRFDVAGVPSIVGRRVAAVDVPDCELLPERYGGAATTFRAGTESRLQNGFLWLAGWVVRWRWMRSLEPLAGVLTRMQRLFLWAGGDASAMSVVIRGTADGARVERRWTLIARQSDGPDIPAMSVAPLVRRILGGDEAPGARDAGRSLTLADYEPAFAARAIDHEIGSRPLPPPLYARVMGDRFARLPASVRAMHDIVGDGSATGEASVTGAANPLGRLIARVVGFPPAGEHALHVAFAEDDDGETWTRHFGNTRLRSRMSAWRSGIVERFGPLSFSFDLPSDARGLRMVMTGWTLWNLPLPLALAPRSPAREWEEDGRFRFDVPVSIPMVGLIVHYRGWLEPGARYAPEGGKPRTCRSGTESVSTG